MNKSKRLLVVILCLGFGTAAVNSIHASGPRQYYSEWKKHPTREYHYRSYYYKPRADYRGYKHHYVVHYASKPNHNYYFNPYKKQFWGRCPVEHNGNSEYSLLPTQFRKEQITDIPEDAFPPVGPLPPIPDSEDGEILDLPPDDLPVD